MKWHNGFTKVKSNEKFPWSMINKALIQDVTVDNFTEEELRGAIKIEIETFGI